MHLLNKLMEDKYSYLLKALEEVHKYMGNNKITKSTKISFFRLEYYLHNEKKFTEEQKEVIDKGLEKIVLLKMIKEEIKKLDN